MPHATHASRFAVHTLVVVGVGAPMLVGWTLGEPLLPLSTLGVAMALRETTHSESRAGRGRTALEYLTCAGINIWAAVAGRHIINAVAASAMLVFMGLALWRNESADTPSVWVVISGAVAMDVLHILRVPDSDPVYWSPLLTYASLYAIPSRPWAAPWTMYWFLRTCITVTFALECALARNAWATMGIGLGIAVLSAIVDTWVQRSKTTTQ